MRASTKSLTAALAAMLTLAACSSTGPVGAACLDSGRNAASAALCSCVQQVADRTLSRSDQAMAASFFEDPQAAQDVRQSDNPSLEAFWLRYRAFSSAAERSCR